MKKTRIVGLLLVFVLITSCFVGGTFAKYTSTASGSDAAVVAKWEIIVNDGTEVDITGDDSVTFDLFKTLLEADCATKEDHVKSVDTSTEGSKLIIAPGTGGWFSFDITNKSEVDAKYTVTLAEDAGEDTMYIQYSLDKNAWYDDFSDINTSLTDVAIGKEVGTATVRVYWRWAFNDTDTAVTDGSAHAGQTNKSDTDLGIAAQGTAPTVTITATILVEQVD